MTHPNIRIFPKNAAYEREALQLCEHNKASLDYSSPLSTRPYVIVHDPDGLHTAS